MRGEVLGTKIVILSGTTDDDVIREVVRAGGDAYLLKNGPARHLIDAISYVRDGGQYFSPQLRRDGLDRHLFEEQPRVATEHPGRRRGKDILRKKAADYDGRGENDAERVGRVRSEQETAAPRGRGRSPGRRTSDSPTPP